MQCRQRGNIVDAFEEDDSVVASRLMQGNEVRKLVRQRVVVRAENKHTAPVDMEP